MKYFLAISRLSLSRGADLRFRLSLFVRSCPALQHFTGTGTNGSRYLRAGDHPRQFLLALARAERTDARHGPAVPEGLCNPVVRCAAGGDLRQMRDAEHLEMGAELAQPRADDVGDRPADAGVDLVEDQRLARS